jgi:hypothetical protein
MPESIRVGEIKLQSDGKLSIRWHPDGHDSHYDPGWLRQHCYDDAARAAKRPNPVIWNNELEAGLPMVSFNEARDREQVRMTLYRKLRDYGFVIVLGGPSEKGFIQSVASMIGDLSESAYEKIFDLSPKSSVRTMGNTFRPVVPHTDEAFRYSPPGINILGCVQPAETGGDSVLVDGFSIGSQLRSEDPNSFSLLATCSVPFHRRHDLSIDQQARARLFVLDDMDQISGVRIHTRSAAPLDLPMDLVEPYYKAYQRLCALMLTRKNQIHFRLNAGDAVVFDNQRVLHARESYSDINRFLQICNVSRESFHERLRLLAMKLGYNDEAHQVLSSGVAA